MEINSRCEPWENDEGSQKILTKDKVDLDFEGKCYVSVDLQMRSRNLFFHTLLATLIAVYCWKKETTVMYEHLSQCYDKRVTNMVLVFYFINLPIYLLCFFYQ